MTSKEVLLCRVASFCAALYAGAMKITRDDVREGAQTLNEIRRGDDLA